MNARRSWDAKMARRGMGIKGRHVDVPRIVQRIKLGRQSALGTQKLVGHSPEGEDAEQLGPGVVDAFCVCLHCHAALARS
jgi:hypothetical protein